MEFVEHGNLNGSFLEAYFNETLVPYLNDTTETIVLGCTHYPFLRPYLKEFLGDIVNENKKDAAVFFKSPSGDFSLNIWDMNEIINKTMRNPYVGSCSKIR